MTKDEIRRALEHAIGVRVATMQPVGGGCVSPAWRAALEDGGALFIKAVPAGGDPRMLDAEARSLRAIAETGAVRVPEVMATSADWLALEWLEPAPPQSAGWAGLGRNLARLHRHGANEYGWSKDNFIGPLPQSNERTGDWAAFWRKSRIQPQLSLAKHRMSEADHERCARVLDILDGLLEPAHADGPSLLHGDLWNGNVHFTRDGGALIDPSCHYGHREVDLAMAALFGGFPPAFFDAYEAEWPLLPGAAARRPAYQLYYLLVHVILFGAAYLGQTRRAVEEILAG